MSSDLVQRDPGGFRPRIFPPIWVLFVGAGMFAASRWTPVATIPGSRWIGVAPVVVGVALVVWSAMLFSRASTAIEPGRVSSQLVTSGPYRLSRNPIYVGMTLVLLGWAVWLDAASALLGAPAFMAIITQRIIRHEERMLSERFGGEYAVYRALVRRWI